MEYKSARIRTANALIFHLFESIERLWLDTNSFFDGTVWRQLDGLVLRTNNNCEGLHSSLNGQINIVNPNFHEVASILINFSTF